MDSKKIEEFTELTSPNLVQTGFTIPLVRCGQALRETAPYSKPNKSVSNLFIINHIVRFLTITNVVRLKSLKSFFILFLIFTIMQLIFWINIVSQVFSSFFLLFFFFFFFEKNIVSYVDALSLLYYVGASCCQPCKHQRSHLERICSFNPREKDHVPNTTWS